MKHNRLQKQLSAYLDDELSPHGYEKIERHLRVCDECVQLLSDFRRNRQWMADLRQPAPPGIWEAAQERMTKEHRAKARGQGEYLGRLWHLWFFRPIATGVGVCVIACLVLMWVYINPAQKPIGVQDTLDLYVMAHAEYATYSLLTSVPVVHQSLTVDASPSTSHHGDTEKTLPEETELFLDAYLGN